MSIYISNIKVNNFKSFKSFDLELKDFNVIIGPNASGKSNLLNLFRFIKDITRHGLDYAISNQGGIEYFRNILINQDENFKLDIEMIPPDVRYKRDNILLKTEKIEYSLELRFYKRGLGYNIVTDKVKFHFLVLDSKELEKNEKEIQIDKFILETSKIKKSTKSIFIDPPTTVQIKPDELFPSFYFSMIKSQLDIKNLLIQEPFIYFPYPWEDIISSIKIFDIDPKLPKKATPISGSTELMQDGSNLAVILRDIFSKKEKKRKFLNLIKDLLPFIDNVYEANNADKTVFFKLKEKYYQSDIPSSLVSDGTINIISILVTLYFQDNKVTIIEEPEKNVHPYLLSKIVSLMNDASLNKQIIISTHTPALLKSTNIDDIILVTRDNLGFSNVSKPSKRNDIKIFLKNDLGIDELQIQNLF